SRMDKTTFFSTYGQSFRGLPALPGPASDNLDRIYDLHHRYAGQVMRVVDEQLIAAAPFREALKLPPTCLVRTLTSATAPATSDAVPGPAPLDMTQAAEGAAVKSR